MPEAKAKAKIAVIGGSGLYDIEGLTDIKEVNPDTPFGKPQSSKQQQLL
jgi:5'-methylthioadenosine phosphorylase